MNKKSIIMILIILAIVSFFIYIYTTLPPQEKREIETEEQAAEKIGNMSENIQDIGSTLEDIDQSIG